MKRKQTFRVGALVVSLMLLAGCIAVPALAEEYGTVRNPNGGSYVNVRSWPSYDAGVLTQLGVGSTVQITGTTGAWYSVWTNGVVGYIHSNFLSVQGGGNPSGTATVRSGPLNLREAPSMRARVIMQLPTGYRVSVLSTEGTWSQIQAGNTLGYVVTSYLSTSGGGGNINKDPINTPGANATIRTSGGNLNLRSSGSSMAPVIDSYGNGSRIRVITAGSVWSYVQAGNQYGYMSSQFLRRDSGGGSTSGYTAIVNNPGAGQVLNLRAEPDMNSRSLAQYANGYTVTVVGVGTEWHRVQVDGMTGYMSASYLMFTGQGATPNKTVSGGANGFVNLRTGPGYDYTVLMRVSNGAAATVTIPYPTWSKVLVRQGSGYTTGYIENSFLR